MSTDVTARKAPLTFEDMLLLFMRRLVAPVAAASIVIGGGLFILFLLPFGLQQLGYELVFAVVLGPAALSAVGLVFVGIPAGYLVARRRLGFRASLAALVGIGFTAGVVAPLLLWIWVPSGFAASLVFAPCGALVAAIWTLINDDLFRLDNGA